MLTVFIVAVMFSIGASAFCSLMEAALYAVPLPHVKHLSNQGSKTGNILFELKSNIGKPIAAILILNTIANSGGAAVAGACASSLWGETGVLVFSIFFTLGILYISEIIPKQLGVSHSKLLATYMAYPLSFLVKAFYPLILVSEKVSGYMNRGEAAPSVSQEEVMSMAEIGTEEGVLDDLEGSVIKNVVGMDQQYVREILTPRVVVFRLEEEKTLEEIESDVETWNYSRVPIFPKDSPDNIGSYVTQRDVLRELLKGDKKQRLSDIARPLSAIPELMRVDQLLLKMVATGTHFFAVVDEHGGFDGVVTMEDVFETMLGREIVDEYDHISDLRYYAKVIYSRSGSHQASGIKKVQRKDKEKLKKDG